MTENHHFLFSGLVLLFLLACTNVTNSSNYDIDNELVTIGFSLYEPFEHVGGRDTIFETTHFEFQFKETFLPAVELEKIAVDIEANVSYLNDYFQNNAFQQKIKYRVYPTIEQKGLALKDGTPAHLNYDKQMVYVVEGDIFKGHDLYVENELYVRKALGQPQHYFLAKGLAVFLNKKWQKKGWNEWAGRLFTSGNMPPLSELLDEDLFKDESNLVMYCAAASFVDFYMNVKGKDVFLQQYTSLKIAEKEIESIQNQWVAFLKNKYASFELKSNKKGLPMLKGFNFSHEGYRVYNGYGSKLALHSIEKMMSKGCNALAIVPYTFMRSANKPAFLPNMRRAGMETDESVIATHIQAKMQGAFSVLKPQIWINDSWPGAVEMKTEADWNAFFDYYHRWMRHYAMMAEIWEMDVLCLGVEFAKATQSHPQQWRDLIQKMRGLYTGPMTYAANWGDEFENIAFWDDLDFIGLDCYYPLSGNKMAKKKELKDSFAKIVNKIGRISKKYNKKIIFTEIGFRSVEATWMQPHEEAKGKKINNEHQALCYEIVLDAIKDQEWCKGILWWKWPSDLANRPQANRAFTPAGKPAEKIVEAYFKSIK